MQVPPQITFREIPHSEAVETRIREEIDKLEHFYGNIIDCEIVIEAQHRHKHKGKLYHLRIILNVPERELVVSRDPEAKHAHEDIYVTIRDAFKAMRRQLQDYARQRRGQVKTHENVRQRTEPSV